MTTNCPKCDAYISDSYEPDDPSVGVRGGYYCDACDLAVSDDYAPMDDDVMIGPAPPRPDGKIGTPISELSGQPGQPGYSEFKRIAKSWGYD